MSLPHPDAVLVAPASTVEVHLNDGCVLLNRQRGALSEVKGTAFLVWTALAGRGTPREVSAALSEVTGLAEDMLLTEISPTLESWLKDGLLADSDSSSADAVSTPGRIPVPIDACTMSLTATGWDRTLIVDVGEGYQAGLRVDSQRTAETVAALVRVESEEPPELENSNVSLRFGSDTGEDGTRKLFVVYENCTTVARSREPEPALAAALRGLMHARLLHQRPGEGRPLLEATALLGPGGGCVLGPALSRSWLAKRQTELDRRGIRLLPRILAVSEDLNVRQPRSDLPCLTPAAWSDLGLWLEEGTEAPLCSVHWYDFEPGRPRLPVSDAAAASATLVANAVGAADAIGAAVSALVRNLPLNRTAIPGTDALIATTAALQ